MIVVGIVQEYANFTKPVIMRNNYLHVHSKQNQLSNNIYNRLFCQIIIIIISNRYLSTQINVHHKCAVKRKYYWVLKRNVLRSFLKLSCRNSCIYKFEEKLTSVYDLFLFKNCQQWRFYIGKHLYLLNNCKLAIKIPKLQKKNSTTCQTLRILNSIV